MALVQPGQGHIFGLSRHGSPDRSADVRRWGGPRLSLWRPSASAYAVVSGAKSTPSGARFSIYLSPKCEKRNPENPALLKLWGREARNQPALIPPQIEDFYRFIKKILKNTAMTHRGVSEQLGRRA